MRISSTPPEADGDHYTTTEQFADHGIHDGSALISGTYHRLADADRGFDRIESFYDGLESAFVWTYLSTVEGTEVLTHIGTAIDDARVFTEDEFADDPDANLRTDVTRCSTGTSPVSTARTDDGRWRPAPNYSKYCRISALASVKSTAVRSRGRARSMLMSSRTVPGPSERTITRSDR